VLPPSSDDGVHRGVSVEHLELLGEVHRHPRHSHGRDGAKEPAGLVLTDGAEGMHAASAEELEGAGVARISWTARSSRLSRLISYSSPPFVAFGCLQAVRPASSRWMEEEGASQALSGWRWTPLPPNMTERDGVLFSVKVSTFQWYFT
jgi:hypothetical protein